MAAAARRARPPGSRARRRPLLCRAAPSAPSPSATPSPPGEADARHGKAKVMDAVQYMRAGGLVAVLDDPDREGETDLFARADLLTPETLRQLRTNAGGEMYLAVGHDVAESFGIERLGGILSAAAAAASETDAWAHALHAMAKRESDMCQGRCSVSLSLDHRSTKTGAPDDERAYTCSRLAQVAAEVAANGDSVAEAAAKLGAEFHTPGHIFMCIEHQDGLAARRGHSELGAALARASGGTSAIAVGCVMLANQNDTTHHSALTPSEARAWCEATNTPFLTGDDIAAAIAP